MLGFQDDKERLGWIIGHTNTGWSVSVKMVSYYVVGCWIGLLLDVWGKRVWVVAVLLLSLTIALQGGEA